MVEFGTLPVAQRIERLPPKQQVTGSSPVGEATLSRIAEIFHTSLHTFTNSKNLLCYISVLDMGSVDS